MDAPDHVAAHLARNLVSLRHARALTQAALARAAAVPRSTVANLESGEGNPSLAVLVKVANALGAPIDEREDTPEGVLVVARLPRRELHRYAPYLIAEEPPRRRRTGA